LAQSAIVFWPLQLTMGRAASDSRWHMDCHVGPVGCSVYFMAWIFRRRKRFKNAHWLCLCAELVLRQSSLLAK